jgi:hypothetical protein
METLTDGELDLVVSGEATNEEKGSLFVAIKEGFSDGVIPVLVELRRGSMGWIVEHAYGEASPLPMPSLGVPRRASLSDCRELVIASLIKRGIDVDAEGSRPVFNHLATPL